MSTAVKMDEDAKSKLEALQAEIRLKTGKKVTQQELLSRLIQSAVNSRTGFLDSFRDGTETLNETELEEFNQGTIAPVSKRQKTTSTISCTDERVRRHRRVLRHHDTDASRHTVGTDALNTVLSSAEFGHVTSRVHG